MSHKRKSIFAARIDGIEREILSVKERSNRDLLLIPAHTPFCEPTPGTMIKFVEQHYSVHGTNQGSDTTITQKTTLDNGDLHSNVSFIHNTKNHLLWPVFARRVPVLYGENRKLTPRGRDKVIFIDDYQSDNSSLTYSVFISRDHFDIESILKNKFPVHTESFTEFKVIVLPMHINLPSIANGDSFGYSTSSQVINNIRSTNHIRVRATSIPPEDLIETHLHLMNMLASKLVERLISLSGTEHRRSVESAVSKLGRALITRDPLVRFSIKEQSQEAENKQNK